MANHFLPSAEDIPPNRQTEQHFPDSDYSDLKKANETPISPPFFWSVTVVSLIVAFLVRIPHFDTPDFPLGEGGLFVLFSEIISKNGFRLPEDVNYSGFNFPFAYPPAAFYLAGAVSRLTGASLFSVFYWLPIFLNLLAVPAFCFVAARVTKNRTVMATASILYVQLVHSYIWQITGGGLPRALGALLALLAIGLAFRDARSPASRTSISLISIGLLVGLSILSHIEWGIFATTGVALALCTTFGLRRGLFLSGVAGVGSAIVVAPWLLTIVMRHGLGPFISISSGSGWDGAEFVLNLLAAKFFYLVGWAAIPGVYQCVRQRNWFPLLFTPMIMILTPRMGVSAGLAIPVALFAGWGVKAGADFLRQLMISDPDVSPRTQEYLTNRTPWGVGVPAISILLVISTVLASPVRGNSADFSTLRQVNSNSRAAMLWASQHTSLDARFVIISSGTGWWGDRMAEWFPYLSRRNSLTTAQGTEWVSGGEFSKRKEAIEKLKMVQVAAPNLLPVFVRVTYDAATNVAVFYPKAHATRRAFAESACFKVVFENSDAAIFETQSPGCVSAAEKGL